MTEKLFVQIKAMSFVIFQFLAASFRINGHKLNNSANESVFREIILFEFRTMRKNIVGVFFD